MIGNRLLTAMLLCGAFMEDERPRRPPSKALPDPEPLDPIDALKHIDARIDALGNDVQLWSALHLPRPSLAFEKLVRSTALACALNLPIGMPNISIDIRTAGRSVHAALLEWEVVNAPPRDPSPHRVGVVVQESPPGEMVVDGLVWMMVFTLGSGAKTYIHGVSIDGLIQRMMDFDLRRNPRMVAIGTDAPAFPTRLDLLRAHQGNALGKTTADLRRLTDGFTALGNAAAGASRIADDIPARAAEPYKPVFPARKTPYIPFYTDAELAERHAQAKAKKAKRKSAQASKRRNR